MPPHPVAVVTGATRGLGRETCRQLLDRGWAVALTARSLADARAAADGLGAADRLLPLALDVTDADQARAAAAAVATRWGRLDTLVNNAGVILDDWDDSTTTTSDPTVVRATFDTNTLGALRVSQAFLPLLLQDGGGNLVNVSSGMGSVSEMNGGMVAYRLSKAALNALTRILHDEHNARGLRATRVCPGWVKTDMGGPGATRQVQEGAAGIVWAATLGPGGPSGGFFRDGRPIAW
jgi:NAD(P)-dependent dehydrogenase (short-subunit alcohol dehydrogenase family)